MKLKNIEIKGDVYVHISSAAQLVGVAQSTVRVGCREGSLVCKQVGGSWYVRQTSIKGFLRGIQEKRTGKSIVVAQKRKSELKEIKQKARHSKKLFKVGGEIYRSSR